MPALKTAAPAKKYYKMKDNVTGYLLLAPWLFGFFFMWLIPAAMSIYYSLTDYNLLSEPNFVGLQNYITIFTNDKNFKQAMIVTFSYVFMVVPLRLAFALFVATLLNKKHKGMAVYRVLYYIPSIVGGSIAVAVVWKQIFGNKGVLMTLLGAIGIEQKMSLLGNPKTALFTIVLMGVWQFGSCMLIFLSGLKQIPNSLYESAAIDGASPMKQFWKITMPMLTPTIFFNMVQQIITSFRVFTESYVITNGGPMDSTLTYVHWRGFWSSSSALRPQSSSRARMPGSTTRVKEEIQLWLVKKAPRHSLCSSMFFPARLALS